MGPSRENRRKEEEEVEKRERKTEGNLSSVYHLQGSSTVLGVLRRPAGQKGTVKASVCLPAVFVGPF
jgi:hypothetical protein